MQTLTHQAQQTIDYQQQRLSPYIRVLGIAVAKTYLLPLGGLLMAYIVNGMLITLIPILFGGLIGTITSLAVFFAVLYYGWRFAEKRWNGTSLFFAYATVGKARRDLQAEITSANPSDATIQQGMSDFVKLSDALIEMLHNNNLVLENYDDYEVRDADRLVDTDFDDEYYVEGQGKRKSKKKRS